MALVCPSCGAENRDKARFCRGCARPLERPGEADPSADPRERRRRAAAARAASSPSRSRWTAAIVGAVLALGVGWWLGARQQSPAPAQAAARPAVSAPAAAGGPAAANAPLQPLTAVPAASPVDPPVGGSANAEPESAAAVDRLHQSVEMLERQDRARAAVLEQQRLKVAQEKQRADEARRRTDALAAAASPASATPAAVAQANAPAAAPAPTAAPSVDQLCAGSSNVFARDFCRMRECGKPGYASDPVCVRFRQMEETRRQEAERR
ncbi:zinc ribbon domain-containing protein [Hydrogenophaga sp. MI9]|uniref:zinc ribbon domain-containing protein n=1 Tax=Hydrogenophaga sp. MI9 TaxID=3453719 RepID=UPI003EE8B105